MTPSVTEAITQALASEGLDSNQLDEYTLEYLVSYLDGADLSVSTLTEMINPILSGVFDDLTDGSCERICGHLYHIMNKSTSLVACTKMLNAPVSIAEDQNRAIASVTAMLPSLASISGNYNAPADTLGEKVVLTAEEEAARARRLAKDQKRKEKAERKEEEAAVRQAEKDKAAILARQSDFVKVHRREIGGGEGISRSRDFKVQNIDLMFRGNVLLRDGGMNLTYGRKYGLVGRNGVGKSTLLREIANGGFPIPSHLQVLVIEQEVIGDDTSALNCVLNTDTERTDLLKDEAEILSRANSAVSSTEDINRLKIVHERLADIDAATAEARAASILAGLGITSDIQHQATNKFSGGWRMRIAIARALFCEPDVLCLDEPTNHLDLTAVLWLEGYLSRWPNTLLVVSHDIEFMNQVCTDIIEFSNLTLTCFKGNYDDYSMLKAEKAKVEKRQFEVQEQRRSHISEFINKFRYNAKRASLVQSRIKALERMAITPPVEDEKDVIFNLDREGGSGHTNAYVRLDDVSFGYTPTKILFRNLDLTVNTDSRIAIVGPNGSGKSTLLKLISGIGELQPLSGYVSLSGNLKMGYFAQHHVDQMPMNKTPLEFMRIVAGPNEKGDTLRSHLSRMGLPAEMVDRDISTLSGGQKSRLALARVVWEKPSVLLLDEVTNHLDIGSIDALISALMTTDMGVVVVSHDERFLTAVCDEMWVVDPVDRKCFIYKGTFEDYKKEVLKAAGLT